MTTQSSATMERLRLDLIRRARAEREGQEEHRADNSSSQAERERDLESNQPTPARAPRRTFGLLNLLGRRASRPVGAAEQTSEVETPKSPEFGPERTFGFPSLGQLLSNGQHTETGAQELTPPPPTRSRETERANASRIDSPDPADVHLAQLAEDGRRRRRNRQNRQGSQDEGNRHRKPKRFLGCLPWVPSRRIRSLILRCLVSGLFFGILLAVCKCYIYTCL
jgi:hypothetical protein